MAAAALKHPKAGGCTPAFGLVWRVSRTTVPPRTSLATTHSSRARLTVGCLIYSVHKGDSLLLSIPRDVVTERGVGGSLATPGKGVLGQTCALPN